MPKHKQKIANFAGKSVKMDSYNPMQAVKRRMFAMRNGVVADALRKGGSPFAVIFGINLPQLVEIAAGQEPSRELAEQLWVNRTTRESLLLAPMIFPRDEFSIEDARRWGKDASELGVAEVSDILCHRLLRHLPYAWELAEEWSGTYLGLRLAFNLLVSDPARARRLAERALADEALAPMAQRLIEEADFGL